MFRYQQQKCVTCLWLYEDKVMIVVDHRKCRFTQFILLFGTVSLHIDISQSAAKPGWVSIPAFSWWWSVRARTALQDSRFYGRNAPYTSWIPIKGCWNFTSLLGLICTCSVVFEVSLLSSLWMPRDCLFLCKFPIIHSFSFALCQMLTLFEYRIFFIIVHINISLARQKTKHFKSPCYRNKVRLFLILTRSLAAIFHAANTVHRAPTEEYYTHA